MTDHKSIPNVSRRILQPAVAIALLIEHDDAGIYLVQRDRSWFVPTEDARDGAPWEATAVALATDESFGDVEINAGQLLSGPFVVEAMAPEHKLILVATARTRRGMPNHKAGKFFGRNTLLALGDAIDPVSAVMLRRFGWLT